MSNKSLRFNSRRSVVACRNGCVACSQPLAAQIGVDILKSGGNAADAAVAVAAALNVTEPCSTGLGGDAFCLFYDAKTKSVKGLNGSGRAPAAFTLDLLKEQGFTADNPFPVTHGHAVTVPGAAAAWVDTVAGFGSGKLTLSEILQPAIDLAESGVPVQKVTAHFWNKGAHLLLQPSNKHGKHMLLEGRAPRHGEVIKLPLLANTFKELASKGKNGFYDGRIAKAVAEAVQQHGGSMTEDDLRAHETTFHEPISTDYKGCRVWEIPPSGQGITALMALNILEDYDLKGMGHNTTDYLHTLIEALRLSFADTKWYCADPSKVHVPISQLLSKEYAAKRREIISPHTTMKNAEVGNPGSGSDTVYFTVTDRSGNACSFVNSNYRGFGTGIVPEGCGFTLQNRGLGFSLDPGHPNAVAPGKRPYHTIIPAMVTSADTGDLLATYGVMGGYMQPQGHVQVLLNMLEFGMDPQTALDQPRFCIGEFFNISSSSKTVVSLEEGIDSSVFESLRAKGHFLDGPISSYDRSAFGRGQVITKGSWWRADNTLTANSYDVYWAGSDPRADGLAIGY